MDVLAQTDSDPLCARTGAVDIKQARNGTCCRRATEHGTAAAISAINASRLVRFFLPA